MIKIAYLAIFRRPRRPPAADFRFLILDFKSQIQNQNSRITSYFTCPVIHALLILTCALQMQVFAGDNSDSLNLSPPSANRKSQIANPKSELPSATEILIQVRDRLPREALLIKGQILSGGRFGKLERACYIEMFLDFGGDPAIVRYKISDAFGTPLEQMTISMTEGGETEYEYETGNPLKAEPAPQPTGVIMDTDVTWNDLSLLFLWRADGRTAREENLRGRDCYVLEFPGKAVIENRPPKASPPLAEKSSALGGSLAELPGRRSGIGGQAASGGKIENFQVVWIDMQMLVLIQMEELDGDGRLQRRMIVKNIKKISDQWMIKNLEIRAYPALHHTLIKVDEVVGHAETGIANF